VQAQTTTITNLRYPGQAVLQNGVAQVAVSFTVGFSHVPYGYHLGFGIGYAGTTNYVKGSATSTPDSCFPMTGTIYVNTTFCAILTSLSNSGTESASFSLTFNSTGQYWLRAFAIITDQYAKAISSSANQDFEISVTTQAQVRTDYTTPYVTIGAIVAVIAIVAVLRAIRKRKKPKATPTAQAEQTPQATTGTPPTVAADKFCMNCGAPLPAYASFCNKCGMKQ
jgi:hypothetical protein